MKLDRLNEYVLITVVMVCGILLAIVCGRLAGTGNLKDIIEFVIAPAVSIITCLIMRKRVWMLIPLFWVMSGQLNSVPGHLPFRDLIIILVVVYFFTLKAFKMIHARAVYGWLDGLLMLNLLYVLSTYVRNPVGVHAFNSDLVGGRPYLEIIFALAGYWVLNQVVMTPRQAKWLPVWFIFVDTFLAILNAITYFIPGLAPVLGQLYGGVDTETYSKQQSGEEDSGEGRMVFLSNVGSDIVNLMYSYFSPLTFINPLHLWRILVMLIAMFCCLKSGHRMTIPGIGFTLLLATYFRKGTSGVIIISLIVLPVFTLLVMGQGVLYELPEAAQRTLSIVPWGKWDPNVVIEAQGSTDWRLEMWDIVMHEQKYIHSKMWGDGFGFTRETLASMAQGGTQEDFMMVGDVHSGPISTIRAVGYVGLALFMALLISIAIRAWKLIRAAQGTDFYPLSLFIGVSYIWIPFAFVFVFGAYGQALPGAVISVAFLNLLSNALAAHRKGVEAPLPLPTMRRPVQLPPAPMPVMR